MKENNKQELSYFRLKLRSYMSEHHPEKLHDTEFIIARADMALTSYCDAVAQGFTHPEAESMASEVLYQGLHFSKTDTFAVSGQYDRLYTELTGTIVLLIESNNLPTVRLTEEASPKVL